MTHARRNFIVAYIVLVGLPLIGLAGVLKAGRKLSAPLSIGGTWKLQADSNRIIAGPCGEAIDPSGITLNILQSGTNVSMSLEGAAVAQGSGALEGNTLHIPLTLAKPAANASCSSAQSFTFNATVDPKSDPRQLSGILIADACSSCSVSSFHATRQPRPTTGAGGH